MIQDTIQKIEERLRNSRSIREEKRAELLELLSTLKSEVGQLSETDEDQAQSIAEYTNLSTREATRSRQNPKLLQHSIDGLKASVEELETTHPRLAQIVNTIGTTLSNLGI